MTLTDLGRQLRQWRRPAVDKLKSPGRSVLAVWLSALVLLVLLWWQVAVQISANERSEVTSARRDLGNLTRVIQEHADRTLHSADQVLRFVRERYLDQGERLDLQRLDQSGVIDGEHFPQIGVIDAQGRYRLSSQGAAEPIDLSDREHFRVHVAAGNRDTLFVSKPVLGRATGKWSIQLTRRITLPDGSFGGVVVLSLDPGYFTRFYSDLQLGQGGVSALTGLDGIARARRAGEQDDFGSDLSASRLYERLATGEAAGSYLGRSPIDGVQRLMQFRRLEGYPLVVTAGLALDDVLAGHRATRGLLLRQAAALSALIAVLAWLLSRYLGRVRSELLIRRYALRQVSARNESLSALFSLSPDGFVGFDRNELVKYVNPAFQQILGAEDAELTDLHATDFSLWLASRCQPEARFTDIHADEQRIVVGAARRVLLVSSRPGREGGLSRLLYFRDVTPEATVDTQSNDLLGIAAHELRTPMASIYGFSELLATHPVSASERAEFIQIIHKQAGHMAQMLGDLGELSRQELAGKQDLALVTLDLQQLAADVIRSHRRPAGRAEPRFELGTGRLDVRGDPGRLRLALLNVLLNAYQFSHADQVIQVGMAARRFSGQQQLGLRVVDNGIGMSPDQVRQVCDRFYRADRDRAQGGTGLGMSIVKAIVTQHGGAVEIDSALGRGTSVTLWLPAAPIHVPADRETALCP